MDIRIKYFFILFFQFTWYGFLLANSDEFSFFYLLFFIIPIIVYNIKCLIFFNKEEWLIVWLIIPFIAVFIPFFLIRQKSKY